MENEKQLNVIDGNRLKKKAVSLLFPTEMETCGHLPTPVRAVTVSTIEDMVYREGVELVRCKDCKFSCQPEIYDPMECNKWATKWGVVYTEPNGFCHKGERREAE